MLSYMFHEEEACYKNIKQVSKSIKKSGSIKKLFLFFFLSLLY